MTKLFAPLIFALALSFDATAQEPEPPSLNDVASTLVDLTELIAGLNERDERIFADQSQRFDLLLQLLSTKGIISREDYERLKSNFGPSDQAMSGHQTR